MKKKFLLLSILLLTVGYSTSSYSNEIKNKKTSITKPKSGDIIPNVLIIRFKDDMPKNYIKDIEKKHKVKSELISKDLNLYKIKLSIKQSENKLISELSKDKYIKYVENDRVMKIQNKKDSMGIMGVNSKNENK